MARALIALVVLVLSGCGYSAPTLRVAEVALHERTAEGMVVMVSIDADNRNEVELPLRDVSYTVTLENGWSFSGTRSPEASLRRLGTQRFRFPAVFAFPEGAAPTGPIGVSVSGRVGYTAPGRLAQDLFDAGIRRPSAPFRGEGRVSLDAAP
ncbi:MAG: LEA type 2 family protein [Phycisphaeraceae bacterium]|nr:LEA type 2 family protein [Phycisphaeraceae bacterium]